MKLFLKVSPKPSALSSYATGPHIDFVRETFKSFFNLLSYMAGIVGVYSKNDSTIDAYYCLVEIQHRGQENAGISALGNHSLRTHKGKRLISGIFHKDVLESFIHPTDYVSIGHVGDKKVERDSIAPICLKSEKYDISVAMNGLIINREEVEKKENVKASTDEELFGKLFLDKMNKTDDVVESFSYVMEKLDKAYYSLVMGIHDKEDQISFLTGARCKRGVKPMIMGRTEEDLYISSESGALDTLEHLGKKFIERRDVVPGEVFMVFDEEFYSQQILPPERRHCAFEWVYTARPDSVIEGRTSHLVRKELGHLTASLHEIKKNDKKIIIGIPDSGRSVALGLHEETDIPFDEGLIKNQYMGRTYIIPDSSERNQAAILKHNPIKEIVKGKEVIFGDDSIVRGTISDAVAQTLLNAGAEKVELLISYAPIFYPCFSDKPDKKLAAKGMEDKNIFEIGDEVAKKLPSIEKVYYNTVDNVVKAIGLPREHLCTRCITGENPFD